MFKSANRRERMPIGHILNHSSATDLKRKILNLLLHCFTRTLLAIWIVITRLMPRREELWITKEASFTDEGAAVDLIGRIHSDVFFQDRFMLNEVNVKVRLVRNKDSFRFMSGEANASYKVKIISAVLLVRKVPLSQSVFLAHAKALESELAKYPIRRVVCQTYTIPTESLDRNHEKLFTGQLPTRLVIGCVDNDAFNGNYTKNPYHFKNFA